MDGEEQARKVDKGEEEDAGFRTLRPGEEVVGSANRGDNNDLDESEAKVMGNAT